MKQNILKYFGIGAIIGIIFLFTFPNLFYAYNIGLDSSYLWGLNWLFVNDYETLKQLSYPFGPLSFLKIPTAIGNNILSVFAFFIPMKLIFIILSFKLAKSFDVDFKTAIPIVLIMGFFSNIDFILVACCIILHLLFYKKEHILYFVFSILLAYTGLFIKVSIGISCFCIIAVSMLIHLVYKKDIIDILKQTGVIIGIGLIYGLIVFGGFKCFFQFLFGVVHLSSGYGETLSLHPENNWWLLSLFLLLMISFPFLTKEKDVRIACLLSFLPLLAMWKHSFIREDAPHYSILITFLFIFWGIILLVAKQKRMLTVIIAATTILLLYMNMRNIPYSNGIKMEMAGINHFVDILDYKDFKKRVADISERNVAPNRLTEEQRKMIGDETVDVYPWEFSYAAVNNFNWTPRKTLEIGASTSRWASEKAAQHYLQNENSPEFILFHLQEDRHGGKLGSLDDRYLLNDEPLVMYNIFNNYSLREKTDKYLLFERDSTCHFEESSLCEVQNSTFNTWIDVPESNNEIVRLQVISKNTFLGNIKKTLYKSEEYYIDYLFEDGVILSYRYIPATAVDGLWCHPFVRYPNTNIIEPKVAKVRLRNSNARCVAPSISVQFQKIRMKENLLDSNSSPIHSFLFGKQEQQHTQTIHSYFEDFDDLPNINELYYDVSNTASSSGDYSNQLHPNIYSYVFDILLDTIWNKIPSDMIEVEANVEYLDYLGRAEMMIALEDSENSFGEVTYFGRSINKNIWHHAYLRKTINRKEHSKGHLKIYAYNFQDTPVFIDNFKVTLKYTPPENHTEEETMSRID